MHAIANVNMNKDLNSAQRCPAAAPRVSFVLNSKLANRVVLEGLRSEGFEKLVWHVAQVKEGTLGFPLQVCQLLHRRGQHVHVTLVAAT